MTGSFSLTLSNLSFSKFSLCSLVFFCSGVSLSISSCRTSSVLFNLELKFIPLKNACYLRSSISYKVPGHPSRLVGSSSNIFSRRSRASISKLAGQLIESFPLLMSLKTSGLDVPGNGDSPVRSLKIMHATAHKSLVLVAT